MGVDNNTATAHERVVEPTLSQSPPPSPTPTAEASATTTSVSVSSVVALLIDAQDKLERQRQLRWASLTRSQNIRASYISSIQTTLKEVEEEAKRRNRVQLASFLRHEHQSRQVGHERVEEALVGLEVRWQKAYDALATSLAGVLLEARKEEREWNEMVRRLGAEEQARLADELPVMLRTALEAWKTEDQAEESWRTAWETTNLTLERLSQRVHQQPSQPSQRRAGSLMSSTGDDDHNAGSQVLERRQTRRMTETRRQIEASTSSSSSSSLNVSLSLSASDTTRSTLVDPDLHYDHPDDDSHARTPREYMYSPIKNQMPGQELFDESLERISPDPNTKKREMEDNHDHVDAFSSPSPAAPSSSSLHPSARPFPTRSKGSKIRIRTTERVNSEEEEQTNGTSSSTRAAEDASVKPVASPARSSQSQPDPPPFQPPLRRTTSIKRTTSNTSMKTSASTSSKPRVTASTAPKDAGPKSPLKKSSRPVPQLNSPNSSSTGVDMATTTPANRKVKEERSRPRSTSGTTTAESTSTSTPTPSSPSSSWADYETRWRTLKSSSSLTFSSIPWPIVTPTSTPITDIEGIVPQLIAEFILSPCSSPYSEQHSASNLNGGGGSSGSGGSSLSTKKRIRAALLRWHPDRFNATILKNVVKSDRKAVQDGVGKVVRILNEMLAKEGGGSTGAG